MITDVLVEPGFESYLSLLAIFSFQSSLEQCRTHGTNSTDVNVDRVFSLTFAHSETSEAAAFNRTLVVVTLTLAIWVERLKDMLVRSSSIVTDLHDREYNGALVRSTSFSA